MRIITLNINMFNYLQDDSLNDFLEEYQADIVILQEVRSTKINGIKKYSNIIYPNLYSNMEMVDGRFHLTTGFCANKSWFREETNNLKIYNRCFVKIRNSNSESILGVHIPLKEDTEDLISAIKSSNCDIICGDFNANIKKHPKSRNSLLIKDMISDDLYFNLWQKGMENNKAFYINYKGEKNKASIEKTYKTYVPGTHIDYIFGKSNVDLNEIIIDMRTLVFTDHCAIIIDCNIN